MCRRCNRLLCPYNRAQTVGRLLPHELLPMRPLSSLCVALLALALPCASAAPPAEAPWTDLLADKGLGAFRGKTDGWLHAGGVALDAKNSRRLTATPGKGVVVNSL